MAKTQHEMRYSIKMSIYNDGSTVSTRAAQSLANPTMSSPVHLIRKFQLAELASACIRHFDKTVQPVFGTENKHFLWWRTLFGLFVTFVHFFAVSPVIGLSGTVCVTCETLKILL